MTRVSCHTFPSPVEQPLRTSPCSGRRTVSTRTTITSSGSTFLCFDESSLPFSGVVDPDLQGNRVTAAVEEMNGGNYTCHLSPDGKYLNHTTVLVQLDSDRTVILRSSADGENHSTDS